MLDTFLVVPLQLDSLCTTHVSSCWLVICYYIYTHTLVLLGLCLLVKKETRAVEELRFIYLSSLFLPLHETLLAICILEFVAAISELAASAGLVILFLLQFLYLIFGVSEIGK